ncbi:glycine receptor subunit alpha-4-like [Ischnura elegans]|uniref:glycine receptor subunit alpha-4-like n=1 Tax=Ischnura elegans TaxID=197161 RepID=UPI001ED87B86|nr:glycine receptor subunit alpha-4-like [Ischnura elegans]
MDTNGRKFHRFIAICSIIACAVALADSEAERLPISRGWRDKDVTGSVKFSPVQKFARFTEVVPDGYSVHEPPPLIDGKAVPVEFSVSVKNIPDVNELKQELSVEMNLRIYWRDTRLSTPDLGNQSSYVSVNPTILLSKIWVPDVYTDYAKGVTSQKILSPPVSLRIYPNGTVRYSARFTMHFACPMEFRMYPGDSQRCEMRLESYGYTRKELNFSWKNESRVTNIDHRLAHFDYYLEVIDEKGDVNFPSGSYPAITLVINLRRRLSYHLLQTYVPSTMFVVVSWLSFLVPPESVPGRMAICMTTLLTLTAMFAAVRQNTPSVSYVKALDIWMVVCILFVFLTLAEYTLVLRLAKNLRVRRSKKDESTNGSRGKLSQIQPELGAGEAGKNGDTGTQTQKSTGCSILPDSRNFWCFEAYCPLETDHPGEVKIRTLEIYSAITIPLCFFLFNLGYWPWLIHG